MHCVLITYDIRDENHSAAKQRRQSIRDFIDRTWPDRSVRLSESTYAVASDHPLADFKRAFGKFIEKEKDVFFVLQVKDADGYGPPQLKRRLKVLLGKSLVV